MDGPNNPSFQGQSSDGTGELFYARLGTGKLNNPTLRAAIGSRPTL
jgi:hypothetical protein